MFLFWVTFIFTAPHLTDQIIEDTYLRRLRSGQQGELRGELLVGLKDLGGLTYAEINKIHPFDTLNPGSLSKLYMDAKTRLQKNNEKK